MHTGTIYLLILLGILDLILLNADTYYLLQYQQKCPVGRWPLEAVAAGALGKAHVGRASYVAGWVPAVTSAALVKWSGYGYAFQVLSRATRVRAPVSSCWAQRLRA